MLPDETRCLKDASEDALHRGCHAVFRGGATHDGHFLTREEAEKVFPGKDFSSSPYFFVPTRDEKGPIPYKDLTEVFREVF